MLRTMCATLLLVLSVPAVAGDDDHERARAALERGEVMSLRHILDRVEREHPGRIVEVELEREHGRWIYEIRVLRDDGALLKLELDARDGALLRQRSRDRDKEIR